MARVTSSTSISNSNPGIPAAVTVFGGVLTLMMLAGTVSPAANVCAAPDAPMTCSGTATVAALTPTPIPSGQCVLPPYIRFVVVGDYGACTEYETDCEAEVAVAKAIREVNPDFVIAVGDLNYADGHGGPNQHPPTPGTDPVHISQNNMRVYPPTLFPETTLVPPVSTPGKLSAMAFPPSSDVGGIEIYESFIDGNRFFPTWGNHDYRTSDAGPAESFFNITEFPYVVNVGPIVVVAVDSNYATYNGTDTDGYAVSVGGDPRTFDEQESAVREALKRSKACWRVVFMHHPAYHTGKNNHMRPSKDVREFLDDVNDPLPEEKRADLILSGHIHGMEAAVLDGAYYVLSGAGGKNLHAVGMPEPPAVRTALAPQSHGFVVGQVYTRPHKEKLSLAFVSVEQSNPGATPWSDRYTSAWQHIVPKSTSTGTVTAVPTCEHPWCASKGTCSTTGPGTPTPTPFSTSLAPCLGTPACFSTVPWFDVERPSCPGNRGLGNRQLMRATITLPVCPSSVSNCSAGLCCPIRAVARNEIGEIIATVCLEAVNLTGFTTDYFQGTTACIFDELTTPSQWSIEEVGTIANCQYTCSTGSLKLKVEYTCCVCAATFPTNTPTPTATPTPSLE